MSQQTAFLPLSEGTDLITPAVALQSGLLAEHNEALQIVALAGREYGPLMVFLLREHSPAFTVRPEAPIA